MYFGTLLLLFLTTFIKFTENRENDTLKKVIFVALHGETNRLKQLEKYYTYTLEASLSCNIRASRRPRRVSPQQM